ncbi:DNA polymerase IV [Evtepia sp.]|uniref:DNA polymerase Y family protein n=1 Tax=Evtepia sp. TaxID=2773933 RepID=UPI003990C786
MSRIIFHSDLNCFYASVEMMLDPSLRGKAVAVCGATEDRHGIVLAKSEKAKKAGVKTGMVNWEAKGLCKDLILVPPQYDQYLKYSALTRSIYQRYTDLVEPYGMDECWLDVTGNSSGLRPTELADEIRRTVKDELGLTVSIGVSYNKIFAKLGSDMKKPDAVTEITEEDFKEKVWPLPASELLYVGRATTAKLERYGVHTIGDISKIGQAFMHRQFGVNGDALWLYASGLDQSRVMHQDFVSPVKSVGRGITCNADLFNEEEVWKVMLALSQDIGHKLRLHGLEATGVQIFIRNSELYHRQYQEKLPLPTRSPLLIAQAARELFHRHYIWTTPVRAVTVRATNLIQQGQPLQASLFHDISRLDRQDKLDTVVENLRRRFGKWAVYPAALMGNLKMPSDGREVVTMPGMMYQ